MHGHFDNFVLAVGESLARYQSQEGLDALESSQKMWNVLDELLLIGLIVSPFAESEVLLDVG
jgi:hypothetical protein